VAKLLMSREAGVLWLLRDSYIHDVYMSGSEIGRDHMILHTNFSTLQRQLSPSRHCEGIYPCYYRTLVLTFHRLASQIASQTAIKAGQCQPSSDS
jgi:hypothetical protein